MKKWIVTSLVLLVAIGATVHFLEKNTNMCFAYPKQDPGKAIAHVPKQHAMATNTNIKMAATNPKKQLNSEPILRDKREWLPNCLDQIEQLKSIGQFVEQTPESGMINKKEASAIAKGVLGNSMVYETNLTDVVLFDDLYIVSLFKLKNPFYYYDEARSDYAFQIGIDAWSGEHVMTKLGGDSVCAINLSRNTGGDGSEETIQAYQKRLGKSLYILHERIRRGQALGSEFQSGMIEPEKAIKVAAIKVEDRDYDRNKKPWPILVDDIYVVTFWKKASDVPPEGGKLYDSRVGVDAKTGEFVAMDVTLRKQHHPVSKERGE